jgi:uncharacterized protein
MKAQLVCFVSGLVFALGLGISGMTRPVKVIGFLDFFGAWDASLAFVMLGAVVVYFFAYRWSGRMRSPWLAASFALPTRRDFDARLIVGATIFGAGWGLGGFCPGPALTALASGALPAIIFVIAMVLGMYVHRWFFEFRPTTARRLAFSAKDTQDA